jgi:hypothetical protein
MWGGLNILGKDNVHLAYHKFQFRFFIRAFANSKEHITGNNY